MQIEYYNNSIDDKEQDIRDNLDKAMAYNIDSILTHCHITKSLKKNYGIRVGTYIDYPLSFNSTDSRISMISSAIDSGADFVAITVPYFLILHRKYNKFRDDIANNLNICNSNNVELRYILEYRKFDHILLQKVCDILKTLGVNLVYPSTGLFIDSIDDNITACAYLNQKTNINTIVNGNIWQTSHIKSIMKIKPSGISTNQIESLYIINKYASENQ